MKCKAGCGREVSPEQAEAGGIYCEKCERVVYITRNPHALYPDGSVKVKVKVGALRRMVRLSDMNEEGEHWDD